MTWVTISTLYLVICAGLGTLFLILYGIRLCRKQSLAVDSSWITILAGIGFSYLLLVPVMLFFSAPRDPWTYLISVFYAGIYILVLWYLNRITGDVVCANVTREELFDILCSVLEENGFKTSRERDSIRLIDHGSTLHLAGPGTLHAAILTLSNGKKLNGWKRLKQALRERIVHSDFEQTPILGYLLMAGGVLFGALSGSGLALLRRMVEFI